MKYFHTVPGPAGPAARGKINSFREKGSLLLGSVDGNGRVEFLNAAWEDVIGSRAKVAAEQPLRELIPLDRAAADRLVNRLLDPTSHDPVEIDLQAGNGVRRRYLWHRRFEPDEQKMYIAGEEITGREAEK